MNYIIIDQGTSSTKAFLINTNGRILYSNKAKYDLQRPRPFHIECDPKTILNDIKRLFYEMISLSIEEKINGVGIAFQRSTFLFWEKSTCKPVTPAISWQDSRANKVVTRYKKYEKEFAKELSELSEAERKLVLEKSKIASQVLASYNKSI